MTKLDENGNPIEEAPEGGTSEAETKMAAFEQRAKKMGADSAETYFEWLEAQVAGESPAPLVTPVAPVAPVVPAVAPVAAANPESGGGMDAETRRQFIELNAVTAHAILESQYNNYNIAEREKDEAERSPHTKADLMAAIKDKTQGALIQSVAADFDDNMWDAAAHVLDIKKNLATAKAEGAASAEALAAAKTTALPVAGGRIAEEGSKEDDPYQALADEIAPKEGGYVEP